MIEITNKIPEDVVHRIEHNFNYYTSSLDHRKKYEKLGIKAKSHAYSIVRNTPPGREQSLALTALEEAVMWANAAIVRNGGK